MTTLRAVGFFRELCEPGDPTGDGQSLEDARSPRPLEAEPLVVNYLRQGHGLAAAGEYVSDVLNPSAGRSFPLAILTDGKFAWRSDLAYYVSTYHVQLPDDFIEHMRANRWTVPKQSLVGDEWELTM